MANSTALEKLTSALKEDPSLEGKLRQALDTLSRESGETADERMVVRAAEALGYTLSLGDLTGAAAPLEDDLLSVVAGGAGTSDKDGKGFNFNTWLGSLLREWEKKDSARTTAGWNAWTDGTAESNTTQ